jgi:hypothetical protein
LLYIVGAAVSCGLAAKGCSGGICGCDGRCESEGNPVAVNLRALGLRWSERSGGHRQETGARVPQRPYVRSQEGRASGCSVRAAVAEHGAAVATRTAVLVAHGVRRRKRRIRR